MDRVYDVTIREVREWTVAVKASSKEAEKGTGTIRWKDVYTERPEASLLSRMLYFRAIIWVNPTQDFFYGKREKQCHGYKKGA